MIDVELNGCATSVTRLDRVRNGLLESPEERSDPELLVVAEDDDKKFETENTGSALRMFESGDWERHRLQQCNMMNSSEEQRVMEEKEENSKANLMLNNRLPRLLLSLRLLLGQCERAAIGFIVSTVSPKMLRD